MNEQKISHIKAVLADLRTERTDLDIAIQIMEQRLAALQGATTSQQQTAVSSGVISTGAPRRPGGMIDTVERLLQEADQPLHATAILQKLQQMGRMSTTLKSLTGSMPQDSKKRFENLGKNVWALRAWPDAKKDSFRPMEMNRLPLNEV